MDNRYQSLSNFSLGVAIATPLVGLAAVALGLALGCGRVRPRRDPSQSREIIQRLFTAITLVPDAAYFVRIFLGEAARAQDVGCQCGNCEWNRVHGCAGGVDCDVVECKLRIRPCLRTAVAQPPFTGGAAYRASPRPFSTPRVPKEPMGWRGALLLFIAGLVTGALLGLLIRRVLA